MKIKYEFADGTTTEVEVSEEVSAVVVELDRQEYNINHKETRRHCSLEAFNLDDTLFPSDDDVERDVIAKEEHEQLYCAIHQLTERQQKVVVEHFFKEKSLSAIAREQHRDLSTIQESLRSALKKLKRILQSTP